MEELDNKVLKRQLKKLDISDYSNLSETKFKQFLQIVQQTYDEMDNNVYRLENSLDVSSKELNDLTQNLEIRIEEELSKNREKDKQLLIQAKFAAMGEMIANIAHQWRQPLSGISTVASSMLVQIELELTSLEEAKKSYEKILEFTGYLTQTIEDFRDYFKKDKYPREFNIVDCMNKTINIVEISYKNSGIKIVNSQKNQEYLSLGFQNELKQVLINILNNAKDALIPKDLKEKFVKIEYKKEGLNSIISIYDNAGGIPKDIIDNIFEPYFTTKHKSQGTGLGLYMCKQIIENHANGEIIVENKDFEVDGKSYFGACFNIKLKNKE